MSSNDKKPLCIFLRPEAGVAICPCKQCTCMRQFGIQMAQEERASFGSWVTWFMAIVCIIQSGIQNQMGYVSCLCGEDANISINPHLWGFGNPGTTEVV